MGNREAMGDPLSPFMENLIFLVVIAVFAAALLFFLMTLVKRIKRLRDERKKKKYRAAIEAMLFRFLFEDPDLKELLSNSEFEKLNKDPIFQRVAIKAIISLHDNYSGIYSKKLEQFYEESKLVNYSITKLESARWPYIVEGVRDLSTLNHSASYSRIASRIIHPHDLVKTEVLLALVKMRGIGEIMKFQKTGLILNDWIQSNILFTVKKHKISPLSNFGPMLESNNPTVALLGVRLIDYYQLAEYNEFLSQLLLRTKDPKLKQEILQLLSKNEFVV